MPRPNIICFVTDQQRSDHLGCMGNPDLKTPNLDKLASEGALFRNSFVANPVCSPNRACMFTGQYPKSHGLRENGNALPLDAITLPKVLKEAGYQTFSSGKLHLSPYGLKDADDVPEFWRAESKERWDEGTASFETSYHGLDKIFFTGGHGHYNFGDHRNNLKGKEQKLSDAYIRSNAGIESGLNEEVWSTDLSPEEHYNTDIADHAISFIQEREKDDPFFLWCSFPDPHHPFSPPEPYYSMYKGEDIEVDPISKPNIETFPPILQQYFEKQAVDSDGLAESIAKNYGMITMVDDQIGRVVKVLQDQEIYDNTIIVFLSDHGDYFGDHGLRRKALMPYDGVWRVPTIWRVPGAGAIDTQSLHSTVDIMPTLLELAGLECPTSVQGVSQAGVIHGNHPQAREVIYGEFDEAKVNYAEGASAEMLEKQKQRVRYVRDESTVLAYIYGADFGMMFDTESDPAQLNNLFYSEDHRELRARMMEMLAHEGHRADHWHPKKVCHA